MNILTSVKRRTALLLAFVLFASVLSPVQISAQSQNEVLINVLYDGTSFDTDPLDDGSGDGVHTPGLDGGENNNVVKTYDTFAVRIDWNVNEDAATGVFLQAALPAFASWAPDATGMFAGCDPTTSSFPDDQTLICSLLDQQEGSNGTIRALATLDQPTDGTEFNIPATLTTDDDPTGISDELDLPLVVSEAPIANWLKASPEISATSSGDGYVFVYPLSLIDFGQGTPALGAGPINSALPIDFFDHAYQLVASATVATAAQMADAGLAGRSSCGAYDGAGAFPVTPATWTCGAETSPNGYPVVPLNVVGYDAAAAPATNADGSANSVSGGVNVLTGQVAFWLPIDEVDAEIADASNDSSTSAFFENAIAQEDDSVSIASQDDVLPILVPGTAGYFDEISTSSPEGDDPADNAIRSVLGIAPSGGSPGSTIGHNVVFHPGPLQIIESYRYGPVARHNIDIRPSGQGGLWYLPDANLYQSDSNNGDYIGETPRGATLTIQSQVFTNGSDGSLFDAPIHGCTAFDTAHYSLTAFGDIAVSVTESGADANTPVIVGGYSEASNTGPLAHVYTGSAHSLWNAGRGQATAVGGEKAGLSYVVEFTDAPIATVGGAFGADDDQLTCNDSDAGGSGWVDATGDLSVFDTATPGDDVYEGITRARIRITERFPWAPGDEVDSNYTGFQAFFQVLVKADLAVQTVNQELFVAQSHSYGDLGADGVPDLVQYEGQAPDDCQPYSLSQWEANGNSDDTATGWCNNNFVDDGADSFDTTDSVDWDNSAWHRSFTSTAGNVRYANSSGSVISIVEAALGFSKSNNAGLGDIKNNGQLVEFTLSPRVVGSTLEALTNVRLSDNLPANYHFVQFLTLPSTPGSSCVAPSTPDGTITCQFSEPDPAVDTGLLPAGLPGGWSDEIVIQVEVVGAVASADSPTVITNTATTASTGLGPWDPATESFIGDVQAASKSVSNSANSFLPLPADEGAIIKTVDTLEGACDLHPTEDPPPVDWVTRCSEIGFEDDMSFVLSLTNEGNTEFTNIEIVDVFPHNNDGVEPASNTPNQGSSLPYTIGDGRDPASDFAGTLGFISVDPVANATGLVTWVSGDPSATISRDPAVTVGQAANTWCDAVSGTVQVGTGTCPQAAEDVTATYSVIPGALAPNDTLEIRLNLDSEGVECDDHWTNTFGARVDQILLPIRSNDVTVMVQCEYDLALEKTIDPAFVPGADWLTPGVTTVDFLMEVINQGDPVEDFEVTDYVDTTVFTFDVGNNPDAATADALALPYTWDATDPAAPVVSIDGALANGESVFVPVTLIVASLDGPLENWAEISYFDSDGDPTNGDSDPANAANPSTGPLVDEDSVADGDTANDAQPTGFDADGDGEVDGDGTGSDPIAGDEDDHDVAGFPFYDLELIKTTTDIDFSVVPPTVTFELTATNQSNVDVFLVDIIDYGAPGLTYDAAASAAAWTAAGLSGVVDANPTFTINGPVAPGVAVTIPVVYQMTDLSLAPYTNSAEISAFDEDDDDSNALSPFVVDVDSTPDAINDDEVIDHNEQNYDPDADGDLNEPTPGDEDDHDIEVVAPYDLALTKTFDSAVTPLTPGGSITMLITVTNQAAPVATVDLTDYIDASMWQPFDAALNPDGSINAASTAAGAFSFTWDGTDPLNPTALVTPDAGDVIGYGETIVVPITLQPVDGFGAVAPLSNTAEILNFDNDEDPSNGDASDGTISDLDSTPDADNGNGPGEDLASDMVDDAIDGNGLEGGDEDDHDSVFIPVYDLELIKTFASSDFSTSPATVTFELTVNNQGSEDVFFVDVTDYGAPGLTYDPAATAALLPAGVTDANPTFTISGPIAPGASVVLPVVYQMTDFSLAPFVNAAEISDFDADDDPNNDPSPFAFDVDSTPDADNTNDEVEDHNESGYDPDSDGDLNEATPGDEDDQDIEVFAPYDLALQKTIDPNDPDLADGVSNGDELTFFIEVFNQASPIEDFDVTDYVSASWIFDPALNVAAVTSGDQALPFTWDATDPTAPVAQVDGALGAGESVIIPVTLTVNISDVSDGLFNYAEISRFDNDGDPTNGDSDPANPNNPDDGPLIDVDSTPDGDDSNDLITDDVIDGTDDDEDDHDLAFTRWWDLELIKERSAGQDYIVDFSANPITVSFDFTVNNQGPENALNVAVTDTPPVGMTFDSIASFTFSDPADAAATVVNGATANEFIVSELTTGGSATFTVVYAIDLATVQLPAVNVAEISAMEGEWDPDGPNGPLGVGVYPVSDVDSTPDSDPTNDAVTTDGIVDPTDSHNTLDNDADGDGNLHNNDGIDEDDHDTEAVIFPFDLALQKTFIAMDSPLVPGGTVTMLITVTNQGPAVEQVDITDYLDAASWAGFDAALNPDGSVDGSSTAVAPFSFSWDGTDPQNPVALITPDAPGDKIGFGETIAIPITVQVAADFDTSQPLINVAEISRFDNDGDSTNGDSDPDNPGNPTSGPLFDIDSTADAGDESNDGETIGGDLVDDAIDDPNDEDDHDPVIIPIMDLALRKTLDLSTSFPVVQGGTVTFNLEVINQGSTYVSGISLVDYVDPALWEAFDVALNPAGADYIWAANANGVDGDVTITAILAPGQIINVPVTLTIAADADLETLSNTAEISGATATDENGDEVTNPDGSTVVDVDSVADGDNSDPLTDDVTDGTNGDEDDHDIAFVTPPTYSLGNQVWNDADNNGIVDAGEDPIEGVVVHLFSDADGDGAPDDLNGDGIIDENDAIATDTTGPDGDYLFEDLAVGDYIVGIAPENWDDGGALNEWLSSDPTSTDPNDDVDGNDDGTPDAASGYVFSGPVTLDDSEPSGEAGLNNDPNTPDVLSNLTVDFGFWSPVFDTALEKTVASGQDLANLTIGDDLTYTIEVFNQGNVYATDISVIDYIPAALELNDGDWTATADGNATIELTGVTIAPGESVTVEVTMTILEAGNIDNSAEISGAVPVDVNGELLTEPNGTVLSDVDSVSDTIDTDVLSDGVIDGSNGDEDDHDVASITIAPPEIPAAIAFTGRNSLAIGGFALMLLIAGMFMAAASQRREDEELVS